MKKLKLFLTSIIAMFVAVVGVHAEAMSECDGSEIAKIDDTCYAKLSDALSAVTANQTIEVLKTVEDDNLIASRDVKYTINLNDNVTITSSLASATLSILAGDVTITGSGKIEHTTTSNAALRIGGGNVTTTINGDITIENNALDDSKAIQLGSGSATGGKLIVDNAEIKSSGYGIAIFGTATLDFNDGEIIAKSYGIAGNATSNSTGTTININGGSIESETLAGIYHPQNGTLNVSGGYVCGVVGIFARQGNINITGGSVYGNGSEDNKIDPGAAGVEYSTGVGIIVDDNITAGYTGDTKVTISDGYVGGNESAISSVGDNEDDFVISGGTTYPLLEDDKYLAEGKGQSESGAIGEVHKLTLKVGENGEAGLLYNTAVKDEYAEFYYKAKDGYELDKITVTTLSGAKVEYRVMEDYYAYFKMPGEDVNITVTFKKKEESKKDTPVVTPTENKPVEENPKTGDNILMYLSLGLASIAIAGLSVKKLRKSN